VAALLSSLSCGWYALALTARGANGVKQTRAGRAKARAGGCTCADKRGRLSGAWLGYAAASLSFIACLIASTNQQSVPPAATSDGAVRMGTETRIVEVDVDLGGDAADGIVRSIQVVPAAPVQAVPIVGTVQAAPVGAELVAVEGPGGALLLDRVRRPRLIAEEFGLAVGADASDSSVRKALQELYDTPPERPVDARAVVAGGSGATRVYEGRNYLRMSCLGFECPGP
jgi:hypothetical protein